MKTVNIKIRKNNLSLSCYDLLTISIIAFTIILAIAVWVWYGYKDAQIEHELLQLK